MNKNRFPKGWDENRVHRVLMHYETQADDQAVEEDEAAFSDEKRTVVEVPSELMPVIREVIGHYQQTKSKPNPKRAIRKAPMRKTK